MVHIMGSSSLSDNDDLMMGSSGILYIHPVKELMRGKSASVPHHDQDP